MNITKIIEATERPELYSKGTSTMWTDEYISKQLLEVHLNSELDLASRKQTSINQTVNWILSNTEKSKLEILDLGCGPGLYSEIFAGQGHNVTGVDFSKNSIEFAKKESDKKRLNINYICENYLNLSFEENKFDLIILIYTDFGVLNPSERTVLLDKISKILKPGGIFIFDVLNDKEIDSKLANKNWDVTKSGFWKNRPYLALSESFLYIDEKVILFQHTVIDENKNVDVYRFWTSLFSHSDLEKILTQHSFSELIFSEDVLPNGDSWNGENVTFCKAINNK